MDEVYKTIRHLGKRLTKVRKAVIDILMTDGCLLSRTDIVSKLKEKNIKPNRSTIYRELCFLTDNNIVIKNTIGRQDYYEIPRQHHHHLICLKCNNIESINMNNILKEEMAKIVQKNKFFIRGHSLEFYGYCSRCQK